MKKFYYHNGEIISFTDVRMEAGMLYVRFMQVELN